MSSFHMKTSRTKRYNEDGSIIYNTMNATGLANKYKNHNPRFDTNHKRSGDPKTICNCSIAGCGTQCCFNYFLISEISKNTWEDSSKFNKGKNIVSGTKVSADGKEVGVVEVYLFPYSNSCIPLDDCDCSGSFPISVRLVIRSTTNSCVIGIGDTTTLSFTPPTGTGGSITNSDDGKIVRERYSVLGSSRRGKPYRAPIAGYRKKLECCDPNMVQMCTDYCLIHFTTVTQVNVGQNLYLIDGTFYGTVHSVTSNTEFTVKSKIGSCNQRTKTFLRWANAEREGTFLNGGGVQVQKATLNEITRVMKQCKTVTNDVYKDPSDRSCLVEGACYDKRIRSGMQPKKTLTCNNDCDKKCERKYSFSYSEYNKNRVMNTYERGLEKNRQWDSKNNKFITGQVEFFKSSGDACLATYENCVIDKNSVALSLPTTAITTWNPNNKKFKKQGAVSAGSRLERLKLDTIKSANSKCKKGERCVEKDGEKIPIGPYFAGKSRFTGWMYNKDHKEKVWGNKNMSYIRNRPLPLGIPQLTNKCRSTRFIHGKINWRPHSTGTFGVYQRTFPRQRSTAKNLRVVGYRDSCSINCN